MQGQSTPVSFARAAVVMVMAIMLYDVMGAIVKHLSQQYPVPQIAVFRNIFGLVPTVIILLCSQAWAQAGRPLMIRQWRLAIARGGLGVSAQLGFYFSLLHLELATATSLLFAGPMFVTALSVPVLGHRVGLWRWLAVLAGFAGVLMVMRPGADSFTWYAILPLCAAFGYACVSVSSQLFDKEVPTGLINLYTNIGALTGAVLLWYFTESSVPIASLADWFWLAAMGSAGGLAAYCLISAYRLAEPSSLSPFEYFAIPFSFCLGWIFFGETPFDRLIPGVFLIAGGGLAITWREHLSKQKQSR